MKTPLALPLIVVNTDIMGATIATSVDSASVSVGNVTMPSTLIVAKALTQPGSMQREGGGAGLSDILDLVTFVSDGVTVGFRAYSSRMTRTV